MFKKSLSYNVAPWLVGVERKNQNIRSSFEENQADRPLCYVLFCFSLFSLSFYSLDPMEDKMTFRQSFARSCLFFLFFKYNLAQKYHTYFEQMSAKNLETNCLDLNLYCRLSKNRGHVIIIKYVKYIFQELHVKKKSFCLNSCWFFP